MSEDRKKPGVAFWATVALVVVLVVYPLSFGPACWWMSDGPMSYGNDVCSSPGFYLPIGWAARNSPEPIQAALSQFATLYCPHSIVIVPDGGSGLWMQKQLALG